MNDNKGPQEEQYLNDCKPLGDSPVYKMFSEGGIAGLGAHAHTVWLNAIICPKDAKKRNYGIAFGVLGILGAFLYLIFGG